MARTYEQICPIARTLDIIGERWTMLILRDLFLGHTKFNQLLAISPSMPARMLSDRLKMLEERGLVERVVYSQHPLRAEYQLTALGETLEPVMEAMFRWGIAHTLSARERATVLKHLYGELPAATRPLRFPAARRPALRSRRAIGVKS
jgi:DNA-binding HxlR family transcriptional regulator